MYRAWVAQHLVFSPLSYGGFLFVFSAMAGLTGLTRSVVVLAAALGFGLALGFFQGHVLRQRIPELDLKTWSLHTAAGVWIGSHLSYWILNPHHAMAQSEQVSFDLAMMGPPPLWEVAQSAALLGALLGLGLGAAQALGLNRAGAPALPWIASTVAGLAMGMTIVAAGASLFDTMHRSGLGTAAAVLFQLPFVLLILGSPAAVYAHMTGLVVRQLPDGAEVQIDRRPLGLLCARP